MIKRSRQARPKGLKDSTLMIAIRALNLKFVQHLRNEIPAWAARCIPKHFPQKTEPMQNLTLSPLPGRIGSCNLESGVLVLLLVLHEPNCRIGAVTEFVHNPIATTVQPSSNVNGAISALSVPLWILDIACKPVNWPQ
jgi:hypothetical protein